jgi:hypothetical protein
MPRVIVKYLQNAGKNSPCATAQSADLLTTQSGVEPRDQLAGHEV